MLTLIAKLKVHQACLVYPPLRQRSFDSVLSPRAEAERIHMRRLRRLLSITWQNHVTNAGILSQAGTLSMFGVLTQRRLHWLGHECRMDDGHIPRDVLYRVLAQERHQQLQ